MTYWPTLFISWIALASGIAANAAEPFSHADWTSVLERFVDDRGLVDYEGLARDRATFDRYVTTLQTVGPKSNADLFADRDARLAYYINAYNALVFAAVLDRGPESQSVWKGGLISGYGFFVGTDFTLDGETIHLKELEDETIREGFQDPRIHAALNCASIGCPRLPRRAFSAAELDAELDAAIREFVSDSRHCAVDPTRKTVALSKIFDWFSDDFLAYERSQGAARPNLIDYVNRYRDSDQKIDRTFKIRFLKYDKSIHRQ